MTRVDRRIGSKHWGQGHGMKIEEAERKLKCKGWVMDRIQQLILKKKVKNKRGMRTQKLKGESSSGNKE